MFDNSEYEYPDPTEQIDAIKLESTDSFLPGQEPIDLEPLPLKDELAQEDEQEQKTEPEPPAPVQTDDEYDRKEYSKRVNKRIDKLTYERNIERERVAALEATVAELKKNHDEKVQRQTNQELEQERKELIQKKKDALEIEDYDEIVKIDDQLMDLKVREKLSPVQQFAQTTQNAPEKEIIPDRPQALMSWESQNPWVYDAQYKPYLDKANEILNELTDYGYDLSEQETFDELDKRLQRLTQAQEQKQTKQIINEPDPNPKPNTKPRVTPPPTGGVERGEITGGSDQSTFTKQDRRMMQEWGLNPDNARERAAWIKNKQTR